MSTYKQRAKAAAEEIAQLAQMGVDRKLAIRTESVEKIITRHFPSQDAVEVGQRNIIVRLIQAMADASATLCLGTSGRHKPCARDCNCDRCACRRILTEAERSALSEIEKK